MSGHKINAVFDFLSHPAVIGIAFGIMASMYPSDSMEHLQYYIAMCSFMAAGLVRK